MRKTNKKEEMRLSSLLRHVLRSRNEKDYTCENSRAKNQIQHAIETVSPS